MKWTNNETDTTGAETPDPAQSAAANTNPDAGTAPATGEGQGDTGGGDNGEPKDGETEAPQGAPEKYEAFTVPEGYVLEGDRLEMAHEFAKANNWTQEQAQEGVSTYLKFREQERQHERGLWAVQSEEEFGKDFTSITNGAQRAIVLAESLRPGITERLDATNLGNHPDVLWAFNQLGMHLKPKPIHGMGNEASESPAKTREQVLYPNEAKKT